MIGRLNHVAVAVRDLGKAAAAYRKLLGAEVSDAVPLPDHGVTTVFVMLPNAKVELLEPLGPASPIERFLERNPDGGVHHICYEVDEVAVGASIGVALAPRDGMNFDELFGHSDLALYRAKSEGRNHFRFFDPEMGRAAMERGMLELDLREALERGQFDVHYQPCIDLVSGEIVCCEALIRWRHPVRGLINPAEFIPIAEEIGLIGRIGDWVLDRACEQAASWPRQVKTAVNLSAAQFIAGDLFDAVQKALVRSGLAPERLELEITESLLIDDNDGSLATLHRLRELGVRIALDDFGTGYSSLTYLRQFPFDRIKIDKGFVAEITNRRDCAAIVSAVAGLGRSLGISITAEGIETRDQLVMVRAAGCTDAQGFLFGRPVSAADIVRLLTTRSPEHIRGLWARLSERSGDEFDEFKASSGG
jgi:predicted signal transduction protein with EAL and GGDEF domain